MDLAYDHIQEEAYLKESDTTGSAAKEDEPQASLAEDVQEAYKAFTSSPWGARMTGLWGSVVKQGESVYNQASKELAEVSEDATKGLSGLRQTIMSRTRSLSLATIIPEGARAETSKDGEDTQTTPTKSQAGPSSTDSQQPESETVLSRLKTEAAKRLKDLQKAEDAADEALLRFGSNVFEFLRDAVSIAPPDESTQTSSVLFESKDAEGKRVIHASRFDAQLHVIHTTSEGFTQDPEGKEYNQFVAGFDLEKKTDEIAADLNKYPELRSTMEKLVPDQVPYGDFWKRYYFLRYGIETAESRRRDLLKAASTEDEVGWSDDSDSDNEETKKVAGKKAASVESSSTIQPPAADLLKPTEPRKSNDQNSQADSEGSYDVVGARSGVTTQATGSPKEKSKEVKGSEGEDSDKGSGEEGSDDDDSDEDWE